MITIRPTSIKDHTMQRRIIKKALLVLMSCTNYEQFAHARVFCGYAQKAMTNQLEKAQAFAALFPKIVELEQKFKNPYL